DFLNCNLHPLYWTDPDEFIPERWLKTDENDKSTNPSFQFAGGIRDCTSKFLAITKLKVMIILLFIKYEVRLAGELKILSQFILIQCRELKIFVKPNEITA